MELPASDLLKLTRELAQGSDEAWGAFHRQYGPGIFRQLLALSRGNYDLSTEALQQTYLRVARHVRPCTSETEFAAWLRIVAHSVLRDRWRRQGALRRVLDRFRAEPGDFADASASENVLLSALDDAMKEIADDDRALLTAKYLAGESIAAIARRLQLGEKAVESRLTRARERIRQQIEARLAQPDEKD